MVTIQITPGLWIGDLAACHEWTGPILHACQRPCWRRATTHLSPNRPGVVSSGQSLYLNLVDSHDAKYMHVDTFKAALKWLDKHISDEVLIHCSVGLSRAPSLALLHLAATWRLSSGSYADAQAAFTRAYMPTYAPGPGMTAFLTEHWRELF